MQLELCDDDVQDQVGGAPKPLLIKTSYLRWESWMNVMKTQPVSLETVSGVAPPAGGDVHRRAGGGVFSPDPVGLAATLQRPEDGARRQGRHQGLPAGRVLHGYEGPARG